jgi:ferredoxin
MITRRKLLMLLPAAAFAWKYVLAGTPEISPNYNRSEHWWGMLLDIDKCIGCGNCVRACATENNVPDGYFRTWVERLRLAPGDTAGGFSQRRQGWFSAEHGGGRQELFCAEDVQPLRGLALHAGLSGGRDV